MQTDIFGRKSDEISGSGHKSWWSRRGLSTLKGYRGFWSHLSSTGSRMKKSLKLHLHKKNAHNRMQIVSSKDLAQLHFKSSLDQPSRKILQKNHMDRALHSMFSGKMHVLSNHVWANKAKTQDVDLGSSLHQKLHQMHSNRLVLVPLKYEALISRILEDSTFRTRMMYHIDNTLKDENETKRVLEYGCDAGGNLVIPLSLFNFFKKQMITSNAYRLNGVNDKIFIEWLEKHWDAHCNGNNKDGSWIPDMFAKNGAEGDDRLHPFRQLAQLFQDDILHYLEDVYIEEQLTKAAPGYVKYLIKHKKHLTADEAVIRQRVMHVKSIISDITYQYAKAINDMLEAKSMRIDSISEANSIFMPIREMYTLTMCVNMLRYIIYIPDGVNEALDVAASEAQNDIKNRMRRYYSHVGDEFAFAYDSSQLCKEAIKDINLFNASSAQEILQDCSKIITDHPSNLLENDQAVIDISEKIYDYFNNRLIALFKDTEKVKFANGNLHTGHTLSVAMKDTAIENESLSITDWDEQIGITKQMEKALMSHSDNNTEMYETKSPGIMESTHYGHNRDVIVDHYKTGDKDEYSVLLQRLKPSINALKNRINLYGLDKHISIRNLNRGELDRKSLFKIPTKRVNLFKKDYVQVEPNYNIGILMDQSGSMCSDIELVRDTAITIYEAMKDNEMCNVFLYGHTADMRGEKHATHIFEYENGVTLTNVRSHCNNRDGVAIFESARMLEQRINSSLNMKKAMIVLCDGQPAAHGYADGRNQTRRDIMRVQSEGMPVMAIGMGHYIREEHLKEMYDSYIMIEDFSEISTTLPKTIKNMLQI